MGMEDKMFNERESGKNYQTKRIHFTMAMVRKSLFDISTFSKVLLEMSILWMFVVFIWHPTRGSMRTRENKMQIIRNFGCTNCLSCLFSAKYKQNWHFKLEKCWNAKFLVHPTQEPGELILWPSVTAE